MFANLLIAAGLGLNSAPCPGLEPATFSTAGPQNQERRHDVSDLVTLPLQQLGVELQASGPDEEPDETETPLVFLARILERVAQRSDPRAAVRGEGDLLLHVSARAEAQQEVERCLSGLRMRLGSRRIVIEAQTLDLAPGHSDEVRRIFEEKGFDRVLELGRSTASLVPAARRSEVLSRLLRLAAKSDAELRPLPRLRLAPMQSWHLSDLEQLHFVERYDEVELIDGEVLVMPVLGQLPRGLSFRGRAVALPRGETEILGVDLQLGLYDVSATVPSQETDQGTIQLPEGYGNRITIVLNVEDGGLALFALPTPGGTEGSRSIVVLSFRSEDLKAGDTPSRPLDPRTTAPPSASPPTLPPEIHGVVVEVDGNQLSLSVGRDDGVETGFAFEVYRGGRYLGRVEVTEVRDDTSVATIVLRAGGEVMQATDKATTRL